MNRTLPLLSAALLAGCITVEPLDDTGDDGGSGSDAGGGDGGATVALADAPPPSVTAAVHGASGELLYEFAVGDGDPLQANLASGVLNIVAQMDPQTQLQVVLWEPLDVGGSWPVEAIDEEGLPTNVSVTFIDQGYGGQASGGSLEITGWQATDSPQIMLLSGTFTAGPVTNPDDPTWERDLRDGAFEALRVTAL